MRDSRMLRRHAIEQRERDPSHGYAGYLLAVGLYRY